MDNQSIIIDIDNYQPPDFITARKMYFILNTLNDGWSVKKHNDNFIFTKKHEGRKEVIADDYLKNFIVKNSDIRENKNVFS